MLGKFPQDCNTQRRLKTARPKTQEKSKVKTTVPSVLRTFHSVRWR